MINHGASEIVSVFVVVAIFGRGWRLSRSIREFDGRLRESHDGLRDESFFNEIRLRSYYKCAPVAERRDGLFRASV